MPSCAGTQAWLVSLHFNKVRHPRWHVGTHIVWSEVRPWNMPEGRLTISEHFERSLWTQPFRHWCLTSMLFTSKLCEALWAGSQDPILISTNRDPRSSRHLMSPFGKDETSHASPVGTILPFTLHVMGSMTHGDIHTSLLALSGKLTRTKYG